MKTLPRLILLLSLLLAGWGTEYNPNLIDPDVDTYIALQKTNGGAGCDAGTKFYVNQFVRRLKDLGIWSNISRCNIFCGPDIQSAMTPLVVGTSANTIETYNFVSGDYSQSTGLQGNGTSKFMKTGLTPANAGMSSGNGHLIAYVNTASSGGASLVLLGVKSASSTLFSNLYQIPSTNILRGRIGTNSGDLSSTEQNTIGFQACNAVSSLMNNYWNSKAIMFPANEVSTSGSMPTLEYYVMARNENGTATAFYHPARMCFYSIGLGLTKQQLVDYYHTIQTLQRNLGRAYLLNNPLICWGDSLTFGSGATSNAGYPTLLANQYPNNMVSNCGVSGETSSQILTRWQNDPAFREFPTIIWAGRNDILTTGAATIEANIATMVAGLQAIGNNKYLILSVPNRSDEASGSANYNTVIALNNDLSSTYGPSHYLDIRAYMVSQYDQNQSQDVTDFGNDIPPTSLRFDVVHYNDAGYLKIANKIRTYTASLGWWP